MTGPLLSLRDLNVSFGQGRSAVHAVRNLSFDVARGEIVAIVGESGSGKSNAVLGLLDLVRAPGRRSVGQLVFDGEDLTGYGPRQMRRIRGRRIAMIFQDPMTALNPLLSVGRQMVDLGRQHLGLSRKAAWARGIEVLETVGITAAEARMKAYPHQLSGGIRQRVMIAMALICEPELLIADEPTTALDVTIQAQIIELVKDLQARLGLSIIWITHDLGVVAALADRVIVMYSGTQIEEGPAEALFNRTGHPYTEALLASMPRVDQAPDGALRTLPQGQREAPDGCLFRARCSYAEPQCAADRPALDSLAPGHRAACFRPDRQRQGAPSHG
ncbi:ABC transporter ATP-binding protein [Oceanicola sp. S124]|uniref:ABC transporter ATP-binding protein n=1 Tax=Oceanicola sp. S124 TaxID=1042378 RepID=UPI0002558126|nr:ABC transporter ATP-binding protein [Oceanicola sp. S124]